MTDYAGTFERYFREYSDNGLDRRRTISYQLRAWRYYRCRKTISPQGRWYANLYLDLYGICRRHVDIYLDTTNPSKYIRRSSLSKETNTNKVNAVVIEAAKNIPAPAAKPTTAITQIQAAVVSPCTLP